MKILINAKEMLDDFDRYILIDLRSKSEYGAAHISGAVSLPADDAPFKDGAKLVTETAWAALLGSCGITRDTALVAYDDGASGRAVARFWYVAKHYGHRDVFILDGGYPAASGILPTTADVPYVVPAIYATKVTQGYFIGLDEILMNYDRITFLDVRSPEEFVGDDLRDNPRGGHLRGAILAVMDNFFADTPGQSFASPKKLAQVINNLGMRKKDLIITY